MAKEKKTMNTMKYLKISFYIFVAVGLICIAAGKYMQLESKILSLQNKNTVLAMEVKKMNDEISELRRNVR